MSSFTPRFSTQVSPSCSFSSNSKPYCMPEQPPPWMNTRSFRFGLPSPRMRSPTLRAAASVKTRDSVAVSDMLCTLRAGFCGRNRRRGLGFPIWGIHGSRCRILIRQRDQLPRYDGARSHFNDAVVHVPVDPCLAAEHQPLACEDVAVDGAVQHDHGDLDAAFDEAAFADGQCPAVGHRAAHVAVDTPVEMQAAGKLEVALEGCRLAEKRIDARGCLLASPEH